MNIPTIEKIGTEFIVDWKAEQIQFLISRIIETAAGISAEILVTQSNQHLYNARVNVLSTHSKKEMAKELAKRVALDWETFVEQASTKLLVLYREGEPVIRLGNDDSLEPLEYTLYPLLLKDEHNVLFGDGGTGKSLIANLMATFVQYNLSDLGMVPQGGNVLFLDWETSEQTIKRRASAIRRGLNLTGDGFYYRFCEQPLANEIEEIRRQVIEKDIKLVIADSAGMASGMEADYHSVAIRYARALRSLKVTSLSIDHIAKGEGNTPFGSIYKRNIARSAFRIKHSQQPGDKDLYLALFHDKMNEGTLQKPFGFHIHFEGDEHILERIVFERINIADVPELAEGLPTRDRIKELLKYGARQAEDIAEELDKPLSTINTTLYRNKTWFIKLENKEWGLLKEDEPKRFINTY